MLCARTESTAGLPTMQKRDLNAESSRQPSQKRTRLIGLMLIRRRSTAKAVGD